MGDKTGIEWTDATWNPIRGCTKVSSGCANCYAEGMAARFSGPGQPYAGLAEMTDNGPRWTGKVAFVEERLADPLRWAKPRRVFVNSMSDLFHEDVADAWVDRIFAVMALCPQHTFQVLTKRPERMAAYLNDSRDMLGLKTDERVPAEVTELLNGGLARMKGDSFEHAWPLPNVWLGTSVEDQANADARIPHLLRCPAAVRFLSAEPLLGAIDLTRLRSPGVTWLDCLEGREHIGRGVFGGGPHVDWVIVGGESGPGARPMHPDWARGLRDQCQAAGVPLFFKQWGDWIPRPQIAHLTDDGWTVRPEWRDVVAGAGKAWGCLDDKGTFHSQTTTWNGRQGDPEDDHEVSVYRVGKKAAGRLLDGRTWDEMPGGLAGGMLNAEH